MRGEQHGKTGAMEGYSHFVQFPGSYGFLICFDGFSSMLFLLFFACFTFQKAFSFRITLRSTLDQGRE